MPRRRAPCPQGHLWVPGAKAPKECRTQSSQDVPFAGCRNAFGQRCGALCLKPHGCLLPRASSSSATRRCQRNRESCTGSEHGRGRSRGGCLGRLRCWRGSGVQSLTCCSGSDWPGRTDLCLHARTPPLEAAAVSTHPFSPAERPDAGLCFVDESLPRHQALRAGLPDGRDKRATSAVHPMRRTKAAQVPKGTGRMRTAHLLPGCEEQPRRDKQSDPAAASCHAAASPNRTLMPF